jgi:adenylate cyclase
MKKPGFQFRLTIGAKLIGLVALLLASSVATIVYLSTEMYVQNDKINIQVSNVETTGTLSLQMREIFSDLAEKMRFTGTILVQEAPQTPAQAPAQMSPMTREFFDKDKDFLGVVVQKRDAQGNLVVLNRAFSPDMTTLGDPSGEKVLASLGSEHVFSATQLLKGESQIVPLKLSDGTSAIAVAVPLIQSDTDPNSFSHVVTAFIRPNKFSGPFAENPRGSSYLVDRQGVLLAHTDATRVGQDLSRIPVVKEFLEGTKPQNMVPYKDPTTGESRLASYRAVGFAGLGVVAELPAALAYQAATTMERRSIFVGQIILFIAFWAGYLYSGTITRPIKKLVEAAHRIASGDFKINLKTKGKDEVAHLSHAFNEMAKGLEERDRVKDTFNKFHNKEIAEKLLSGEVKLGGERKEATIFFSDVRGFTAMSETMEPEQVVDMLNEYMTRMVSIIRQNHGIVDKYVGDAIMALWGVPIGGNDDVYHAVKTCLAMREELAKLNELRISRGQSALKIGMGLNVGPVIAGNIGSVEKMEYTVIGDSVNLASRMESMTKEYGTDFLVPNSIYERLKDRFVFEKCKSAKVKGKSLAIEVYKVRGYKDEAGREVIIETAYSSYASEKSDKSVHDSTDNQPPHAEPASAPDSDYVSVSASDTAPDSVSDTASASASDPDEVYMPTATFSLETLGHTTPAVAIPAIQVPQTTAEVEKYFVKMFGEAMGPFTESEVSKGIQAGEFPPDATISEVGSENWTAVAIFGKKPPSAPPATPPAFRKSGSVPPPFRKDRGAA